MVLSALSAKLCLAYAIEFPRLLKGHSPCRGLALGVPTARDTGGLFCRAA